jgi:hypothetical protein
LLLFSSGRDLSQPSAGANRIAVITGWIAGLAKRRRRNRSPPPAVVSFASQCPLWLRNRNHNEIGIVQTPIAPPKLVSN